MSVYFMWVIEIDIVGKGMVYVFAVGVCVDIWMCIYKWVYKERYCGCVMVKGKTERAFTTEEIFHCWKAKNTMRKECSWAL